MVLLKHRRPPPQQVPPLTLRLQVPYFPHDVSHVRLPHRLPQARPSPAPQISLTVPQGRHSQHRLLCLCCRR